MATKFYLHDATTALTGNLPGATTLDALTPTVTATGASTNRTADTTIGAAQTSVAGTTSAVGTAQSMWLRRFVISQPLAAQTLSAQTLTYSQAASESNAASNFQPSIGVYVWRPSSQGTVGTVLAVGTLLIVEPGTTQTAASATASSTSVTAQAGDLLVVEVWRANIAQATSVARTNTSFYDGTTEASTSNEAAFVNFANTINFQYVSAPAGAASFAGSATRPTGALARALGAVATSFTGAIGRATRRTIAGSESFAGSTNLATSRLVAAALSSIGVLATNRATTSVLAAALSSIGALAAAKSAGAVIPSLRAVFTSQDANYTG